MTKPNYTQQDQDEAFGAHFKALAGGAPDKIKETGAEVNFIGARRRQNARAQANQQERPTKNAALRTLAELGLVVAVCLGLLYACAGPAAAASTSPTEPKAEHFVHLPYVAQAKSTKPEPTVAPKE